MASLLLPALVALASTVHGEAPFSCPKVAPAGVEPTEEKFISRPWVDGAVTFVGGKTGPWAGASKNVTSPIVDTTTGQRIVVGQMAQMKAGDALQAAEAAKAAWRAGQGLWPQMSPQQRIDAIERFVDGMLTRRAGIVNALMWEICKNTADAEAEFDRTIAFIRATVAAYRTEVAAAARWETVSGVRVTVRRLAVGIMLCLSPFNYPLNEAYAALIPALLTGNVAIMKVPATGGLAHYLTADAFAQALPPGVINFVSGSGRDTMPPLMRTGDIDILAFIGGSKTADALIKEHPAPHRLKLFLQLEGKNLGIVMPDADLDVAAEQATLGATSFNGQRCTAIKLVMVHEDVKEAFVAKLSARISALKSGLPWEDGVLITPLPEENKTDAMSDLISDAVAKGATVVNGGQRGGEIAGALMRPAVVYPVTDDMRLYHEEQFGPVVPVATFRTIDDLAQYYQRSPFGQQAAVFTSFTAQQRAPVAKLLDILATAVGRININTQCGRSPDTVPFSGRRSSALGTMSVSEALRAFSVEVVVAAKSNPDNDGILAQLDAHAAFLAPPARL